MNTTVMYFVFIIRYVLLIMSEIPLRVIGEDRFLSLIHISIPHIRSRSFPPSGSIFGIKFIAGRRQSMQDVYKRQPIASVVQDMRKGSKWLSAFLASYRPPLDGERYLTDGEVDVYKRQLAEVLLQDNQVTAHLRARVVREQVVGQAYRGYQIGLTAQLVTHGGLGACLLYTSRCV